MLLGVQIHFVAHPICINMVWQQNLFPNILEVFLFAYKLLIRKNVDLILKLFKDFLKQTKLIQVIYKKSARLGLTIIIATISESVCVCVCVFATW